MISASHRRRRGSWHIASAKHGNSPARSTSTVRSKPTKLNIGSGAAGKVPVIGFLDHATGCIAAWPIPAAIKPYMTAAVNVAVKAGATVHTDEHGERLDPAVTEIQAGTAVMRGSLERIEKRLGCDE